VTSTPVNPFGSDVLNLREQVFSLEETHIFSPSLLNTARFGFSRAVYFFTGEPTPGTPAAGVPGFLSGLQVGAVVVGGGAASNPQASIGLAGSNNGSNLHIARNLFTYEDRVTMTKGRHQLSMAPGFSGSSRTKSSRSANTGRQRLPACPLFSRAPHLPSCSIRLRRNSTGGHCSARSMPKTYSA